jgi:hypothetical protein
MCVDCGLPPFTYQSLRLDREDLNTRHVKLRPARTLDADIVVELVFNERDKPVYEAYHGAGANPKAAETGTSAYDAIAGGPCIRISATVERVLRYL